MNEREPILTHEEFLTYWFSYIIELSECDIQAFEATLEGFGMSEAQICEFEARLRLIKMMGVL
jgi:hypothetical protein